MYRSKEGKGVPSLGLRAMKYFDRFSSEKRKENKKSTGQRNFKDLSSRARDLKAAGSLRSFQVVLNGNADLRSDSVFL